MRNRNIAVRLWLNEKEHFSLTAKAAKAGISQSEYLRSLISGHIPREPPHSDFFKLYQELNAIGNSLNQLAARAHTIGFINADEYSSLAKEVQDMTLKIYQAVMQPERIE